MQWFKPHDMGGGDDGALPPEWQGVTGPDLIAKINEKSPAEANWVQAIIDGRSAPPKGFVLSKPEWKLRMNEVMQADPTYDASEPGVRLAARKSATSGLLAQQRTSINQSMGHVAELDSLIDGLGNVEGTPGAQTFNSIRQGYLSSKANNVALAKFNVAKTNLSTELTKTFRGVAGAEADIKNWAAQMDPTKGPSELHAVSQQIMLALNERLKAMTQQYNSGMGTANHPLDMLEAGNVPLYKRLVGDPGSSVSSPDNDSAALGISPYSNGVVDHGIPGIGGKSAPSATASAAPASQTQAQAAPPASMLKPGQVTTFKGRPGKWTLDPKTLQPKQVG
jgi:hypothetical protein